MNAKRFLFTLVALAMSAGAALAQYADHSTRLTPPSPSTKSIFTHAQHRAFAAPAETPAAATADDKPSNAGFARFGLHYLAGFEFPELGEYGLGFDVVPENGIGFAFSALTNAGIMDPAGMHFRGGPSFGTRINDNIFLSAPLCLGLIMTEDIYDSDKYAYNWEVSLNPTLNIGLSEKFGICGGLCLSKAFNSNSKIGLGFMVGICMMNMKYYMKQ